VDKVKATVDFMVKHDLHLTTAESCTAGLISSMLADISGCGSVLEGGFVVYSVNAKEGWLDINQKTIDTFGLTSEEVAREMAVGALRKSAANIAISNTGVAASDDELDGVVCFACAMTVNGENAVLSETLRFEGERNEVRKSAAFHAITNLPNYYNRLSKLEKNE